MTSTYFPIAAISTILLISTVVSLAPGYVQSFSQDTINTTQLQNTTNVQGSSINSNATADTGGLVSQAGDLAGVITNPNSGNRVLAFLFTLLVVGLIAWLILALIPG